MNILYFGSLEGTSGAIHYYHSLVRLGGTVLPFDPRPFETASPWEDMAFRLRKRPARSRLEATEERLLSILKGNRFDLVFVMAENFLSGAALRKIRAELPRPPKFVYHSHDNNYSPGILKPEAFFKEALVEYDCVFTTKSQNVDRYRSEGVREAHYLPSAYEPSLHRPITGAESRIGKAFEAVFIGTYDKCRNAPVETVGWDRLHAWGDRWDRYEGFRSNHERITPRPIYYLELADVLSHCRLALGLLRAQAEDLHTQRTFEIPAVGALQIAPRNEEILGFFEEDKEIVCFGSEEELSEKARYYLTHERAAKRIAEAGRRRCLAGGHTYDDRVREMLRVSSKE